MKLAKFVILTFIITAALLLYTHQRLEAVKLSYEISEKGLAMNKLLDREKELEYNVAKLKSPTYLELQLAKSDVRLVMPERWQVFETPGLEKNRANRQLPQVVRNIIDLFSLNSEAQATPAVR